MTIDEILRWRGENDPAPKGTVQQVASVPNTPKAAPTEAPTRKAANDGDNKDIESTEVVDVAPEPDELAPGDDVPAPEIPTR